MLIQGSAGLLELYITLIHTFAILNYPPQFVPDSLGVKCELRDVISSLHLPLLAHLNCLKIVLFLDSKHLYRLI